MQASFQISHEIICAEPTIKERYGHEFQVALFLYHSGAEAMQMLEKSTNRERELNTRFISYVGYIFTFDKALASSKAGATKFEWLTLSIIDWRIALLLLGSSWLVYSKKINSSRTSLFSRP